jgi:hypothetical protein
VSAKNPPRKNLVKGWFCLNQQQNQFVILSKARLMCVLVVLIFAGPLIAQKLTANTATSAQPASLEDRRKELDAVIHEYWEDHLRHSPEFASSIGDLRFNDQITDYSLKAINESLAREEGYMMRLAAIDPAGLTDQEELNREL